MNNTIIKYIEKKQLKTNEICCKTGDTVTITLKITENNNKMKIQSYSGIIVGKKNKGLRTSIKIRKILGKEWIEQIFLIHNPNIVSIKIIQKSCTRKSKLYFLNSNTKKMKKMMKGLK